MGEMGNALQVIDFGSDFDVDHISCGDYHTCALSTSNGLKCFGFNSYGQLGYGHSESLGDGAGEMGDSLSLVDLGSDFVPTQVDCGGLFTCALSTGFGVKCWGWYLLSLSLCMLGLFTPSTHFHISKSHNSMS